MDVEMIAFIIFRRLQRRRERRRKKMFWIHPINMKRDAFGTFKHLFPDLLNDPRKFYNYFRMSSERFYELENMLHDYIVKQNTNYRASISPQERLAVYLRYLATGETFTSLSYAFRIGISTIRYIITEMNSAVWRILQPLCMPVPTTQRWNESAESFNEVCKMPNCIGSVDGKHCAIKCPPHAGSQYYNYKHFHSIILMAVADAHSNFIMIDVGAYGRDNDSTIFNESGMGKAFLDGRLNIPNSKEIPGTDVVMPFYLVGDEAFPLRTNIMRPYARRDLHYSKRVFNYRLSAARRTVECAFGILVRKFGIFQTSIATNVELAEGSIRSACVLHNYIRQRGSDNDSILENNFLEENVNIPQLRSLAPTSHHRGSIEAVKIRDKLKDYFLSPVGSVPWQDGKCA